MKLIVLSYENLDMKLIKELYYDLFLPAFPNENHIEPYDDFVQAFEKRDKFEYKKKVFILMDNDIVIAGLTVEYFPLSNFINMPYLAIKSEYRGKKLSKILFEEGFKELENQSKLRLEEMNKNPIDNRIIEITKFFNLSTIEQTWELLKSFKPYYCLESEYESEYDPIMNPIDRLKIYDKIGFKIIDFDYCQPPLFEKAQPVSNLYLLTATKFCSKDENDKFYLESSSLKMFYWEFSNLISTKFLKSNQFQHVINSISKEKVFLKMIKF
eukprot:gene1919-1059_t